MVISMGRAYLLARHTSWFTLFISRPAEKKNGKNANFHN